MLAEPNALCRYAGADGIKTHQGEAEECDETPSNWEEKKLAVYSE